MVVMMLDALCLFLAFDLALWKNFGAYNEAFSSYASFYAIWVLLWIITALFSNHYNTDTLKRVFNVVRSTGKVVLIHILFVFVYLLTTPQYLDISFLIDAYFFSILVTIGAKVLILYCYRSVSNKEENKVNFIIIGYTSTAEKLLESMEPDRKFGYQFYGFFDDNHLGESHVVAPCAEIEAFCKKHEINQIYFTASTDAQLMSRIIKFANNNYVRFSVVHDMISLPYKEVETSIFNNIPIVSGRNYSNNSKARFPDMKGLLNSFWA
jgi:FlaA1/EpsC-like NDP-sugar epimerase